MNFSAFVARRYLFSKKSHNVINIISMISVFGVATGTMALIIVLSFFNGFEDLIKSVFSSFDPDLKITVNEGKVFDPNTTAFDSIKTLNYVDIICPTLEENVLLEYDKRMHPAVIKGVPEQFMQMSQVDSKMVEGEFVLKQGDRNYAVLGGGVAYYLSVGLNFIDPIFVYVPKRSGIVSLNPSKAFNKEYIFPKGIFQIQQEIDSKYMLVSLEFARNLLSYSTEVSALEIKLKPNTEVDKAQEEMAQILGDKFTIKTQFQQHEVLYRVMKSEKFAIYLILTFILIVASFNIIGSISMLIIDKKEDITTLRSLGLDKENLRKIFLFEGWMISIGGALLGLLIGSAICWIQQTFHVIKLSNMGSFLIDYYPVQMQLNDFIAVFVTVVVIGLVASWYPVKYFINRYLKEL
jgi:lipoprotein-releasing system permease protein